MKNDFENDFFKLMNNANFWKTMKNAMDNRDMKLITTKARRNYLVSTLKYQTTKMFSEHLLAIEMKRTQIIINKPVYLGLPILKMSKTVMYDYDYDNIWHYYVKPKYGEKAKLSYMDIHSFVVYIKTEDIYVDIAKDAETRLDTTKMNWVEQ